MSLPLDQIIHGDALRVLRSLPGASIDMVMTSPPYWGLRDYGLELSIWDGDETCHHFWEESKGTPKSNESCCESGTQTIHKGSVVLDYSRRARSDFCSKCHAWRGSLGLEPSFELYVKHLCDIFDEVRRILKPTGTCWVNMGDTYSGSNNGAGDRTSTNRRSRKSHEQISRGQRPGRTHLPDKCLLQIPSRFAIEMCNRGWILRNQIIWHKPNAMPSSVADRFTVDFEHLFFFVKARKYWYKSQREPSKSPGSIHRHTGPGKMTVIALTVNPTYPQKDYVTPEMRNKRCVWTIPTRPFPKAHFAVYPPDLIETPIKAGCPEGGVVLDPFIGSGTTAVVALGLNRHFIGIELNSDYIQLAYRRIEKFIDRYLEVA